MVDLADLRERLMAGRKTGSKNARITVPMVMRMRDLRDAGLSAEAVASVIALDYGSRPCAQTVINYTGKRPRSGTVGLGK